MFLALSLTITASGCERGTARQGEIDYSGPVSYCDIPGITAEEISAVEQIKTQRDSFVYVMNYTTETFRNDDANSIGGYTVLFCEWLTGMFGIKFTPEIVEWGELIAGLESGAFDFTGELTATDARRKTYFMTDAIAERPVKIFRIIDSVPLTFVAKERPVRYIFLEGATTYDLVSPYLPEGYELMFVGDYDTAYRALKNESADAFFDDGPAEAAFDLYGDIYAEDFFPLIYCPVSMTTQKPELEPVISVVQKALESGAMYHLTGLYNQGYQDYLRRRLALKLTPEERAYISRHSAAKIPIKTGAEYDNYPVSFYNINEHQWQGIAHDVLREVEKLSGLSFTITNQEDTEWTELLRMLEGHEIDMITELFRVPEREGHFIWSDTPYLQDWYALLSAIDHKDLNLNEVLYSRVGLINGSAYAAMFRQWFPQHTGTLEYNNNIDALKALIRGEVDLVMATRNQLRSIMNYLEDPGFKVNIDFNHPVDSVFGFNKDEELLCSIISKTLNLINTDTIFRRWEHRFFDYRHKKMVRSQWLFTLGVSVLLMIILTLVMVMLHRKRVESRRLETLVTERTKELEAASIAAQAASHIKSEFLANMSHEIRTPINAVTGMTTIARSSSDLNRIYDCLDKIGAASRQLLGLINDILDMSKIEAQKFELAHEPFSLATMARNVSSIIEVRTAEKMQHFTFDLAPDIPQAVIGDEMRLSQILLNLLSNAVKFTPNGGDIQLIFRYLGNRDGKEEIEATVKDTGIGISQKQQARLFNAFVQADSGTAKRFGGTGLGLAISKSLAELMGGTIIVESTYGEGSCFTVRVLLDSGTVDQVQASQITMKPGDFNFKGRTVMLVEDIAINREIVIALLEDTGLTIDCAENGQVAVDMFVANPERYDLIFMDVQMPVMDGFHATQLLRALSNPLARSVPIIAMTAHAFAEDIERCVNAGMNAHIAKPIELESLLAVTAMYLNGETVRS